MAAGVVCGLVFTLMNLAWPVMAGTLTSRVLLFTSILSIIVGLVIFGASRVRKTNRG